VEAWRQQQEEVERRTEREASLTVTKKMRDTYRSALKRLEELDEIVLPNDHAGLARKIVLRRYHPAVYASIQGGLPGSGRSTITISLLTGNVEIMIFETKAAPMPTEAMTEAYAHELLHALVTGRDEEETHRLSNLVMGIKDDDYPARKKWTVDLQELLLRGEEDPSYLDVLSGRVSKQDAREARWRLLWKARRVLQGWDRESIASLNDAWITLREMVD